MLDVPTGVAIIEVIGEALDGSLYPPEVVRFTVVNPYLDSIAAKDARSKDLQRKIASLVEYDEEVIYWYTKAINEPEFVTLLRGRTYYTVDEFGRMASLGYLDTFTIRGNAGEYMARCKAAIVNRAGLRLEIGKLQKSIGFVPQAKATLRQVIFEVGDTSGIGSLAQQEPKSLGG